MGDGGALAGALSRLVDCSGGEGQACERRGSLVMFLCTQTSCPLPWGSVPLPNPTVHAVNSGFVT